MILHYSLSSSFFLGQEQRLGEIWLVPRLMSHCLMLTGKEIPCVEQSLRDPQISRKYVRSGIRRLLEVTIQLIRRSSVNVSVCANIHLHSQVTSTTNDVLTIAVKMWWSIYPWCTHPLLGARIFAVACTLREYDTQEKSHARLVSYICAAAICSLISACQLFSSLGWLIRSRKLSSCLLFSWYFVYCVLDSWNTPCRFGIIYRE